MPIPDSAALPPLSGHEDWFGTSGPEERDQDLQAILSRAPFLQMEASRPGTVAGQADWRIGAYVDSGTNQSINTYASEELAGGAQALLFRLFRQPGPEDVATILEGIAVDKISLHCSLRYPGQDPAELFRDLVHYLRSAGYRLEDIEGSVDFDPLLDWSDPPFPPLIRLLRFVGRWMPRFRVLQVNAAGFNNGVATADVELALAVAKGVEYLRQLEERGYPARLACEHLKFAFTVGTSFYGDAAKLRVLRILWQEALLDLGVEDPAPTQVSAHTDLATLSADAQENYFKLATQALSAIVGGVDLLFLAPVEGIDQQPTPKGRENARNLQYTLSHQDTLTDLYDEAYLSQLSAGLEHAARRRYHNLRAQGGFARATEF